MASQYEETFLDKLHWRTYGKWWHEAPSAPEDFQYQNNGPIPSYDFVEINFQKEVFPTGITIYETYNPGAVVRIWAFGNRGWVKLWEGEPEAVGQVSRLFKPLLRRVNFQTRKLKLELNQLHLSDYTQLDAILLEGTLKYNGKDDICQNNNGKNSNFDITPYTNLLQIENLRNHVISLGLHKNLRTDWSSDFCKDVIMDPIIMGSFQLLPDETIIKIFLYLDLKTLCRCAQVNKTFCRLSQDPLLYKSLNLKPYWQSIDDFVIRSIAKKAPLIRKLDMSWCGSQDIPNFEYFAIFIGICGHGLTHLRLNSCRFVDNYILTSITNVCPNLKELSLNSCRNLKSSDLTSISGLINLTRLDLYRTRIEAPALIKIIRKNKELEHLNLGACAYLSFMDDVARELGNNCPNLKSIDLWKNYSLTPNGIKSLSKCINLEEIEFGWCLQAGSSGEWIGELVQTCPSIKKLFLGALRAITDKDLRPLLKHSPNLEQLDLFGSAVSPDICDLLLSNCLKLKLLDINFCEQISESQVNVWRRNFPKIVIKKSIAKK